MYTITVYVLMYMLHDGFIIVIDWWGVLAAMAGRKTQIDPQYLNAFSGEYKYKKVVNCLITVTVYHFWFF